MSETLNHLDEKIKDSLLSEEKEEMVSKGLKISIKDNGQIKIIGLPSLNLEQLELPLISKQALSKKGEKEQ